jgi:hypothetical protein
MILVAIKLPLTPLIMGSATLASRRWGDAVGGWLVGLPVISGPVSVYLLIERGADFAAVAAAGSVSGVISQATFCIGYALGARQNLAAALLCATIAYVAAGAATIASAPPLAVLITLSAVTLFFARKFLPAADKAAARIAAPHWDLPARIIVATALVLAVTAFAGWLGPRVSGLSASYPVIGGGIAAFARLARGPKAGVAALRGMASALYGFIAFFAVIGYGLAALGPLAAYALAVAVALFAQGVTLKWLRRDARRARGGP